LNTGATPIFLIEAAIIHGGPVRSRSAAAPSSRDDLLMQARYRIER
jgi:hypothetical protein